MGNKNVKIKKKKKKKNPTYSLVLVCSNLRHLLSRPKQHFVWVDNNGLSNVLKRQETMVIAFLQRQRPNLKKKIEETFLSSLNC